MNQVLKDRCAIITGASQGLGFEIAKRYLAAGANLLICARNETVLEKSARDLRTYAGPRQSVIAMTADVSQTEAVASLVDKGLAEFGRLDILVNNAGVVGPIGPVEDADWKAWVRTIEINLLGSVLVSRAVLPHFRTAGRGKIIQLSGGGATAPLPRLSAYAASKAAVIRFIETLAEETRAAHIDVNALAPGALNTRMLDEFLAVDPGRIGREFHTRALRQQENGGAPLGRAADLAVFLASSSSDGITGKLISAIWDPWEALPDHLDDLTETDIYTLRRIVPEDRDVAWGESG